MDAGGKAAETRTAKRQPASPGIAAQVPCLLRRLPSPCRLSPKNSRSTVAAHSLPATASLLLLLLPQKSGGADVQQQPAAEPPGASATVRARRLSLPGAAAATPTLDTVTSGSSLSRGPSGRASGDGGSDASGDCATPAASAASQSPSAHPLPQLRVRFDSPLKTPQGPTAGAAATPPTHTRSRSFQQLPSPAASPSRSAASLTDLLLRGRAAGSPAKAAQVMAVPMADLIHSVASLSRAGREPTYRKQNQVGGRVGGCC